MQSSTPFKLLLQNSKQKDPKGRRSHEQIQLLSELCINNKVFEYLGLAKNSLRQICDKMTLMWTDNPHASEICENQIYFVLEGKAFQYLHNSSHALKERLHHNQDYLMVRKLAINDFFIVYSPPGKYSEQYDFKKYQLMIDQKTLMGKISGDSFKQYFLPLIEQRWKKITLFLRKIQMFESLPLMMLYELSKYMEIATYNQGSQIITKMETNQFVYFILSGEVQYKIYQDPKKSPNKNYQVKSNKPFKRAIIKNHQVFGIDAFHTHTYEQLQMQYSADAKTQCTLYKIDKRMLAIVISSFEAVTTQKTKMSSVNLNDQIQGEGYKTADMAMLTRNVEKIKTSQKRIRDIKLRFYDTSQKNRMGKVFQDFDKNQDQLETGLQDIKYQSCENFAQIKVSKDKNKKLYDTFNAKANINTNNFFNQDVKNKMSSVVISVYGDDDDTNQAPNIKRKSFTNGLYKTALPKTSFAKRRSDVNLQTGGKQQTDIIRTYLEQKLRNQMLKKAQLILERNKQKRIHENAKIKRIYSWKSVKSHSVNKIQKKQIGQQLFERLNKITQSPLLSQIQGERKKLQKQTLKIKQSKEKGEKKISAPNNANNKQQTANKELILIKNN